MDWSTSLIYKFKNNNQAYFKSYLYALGGILLYATRSSDECFKFYNKYMKKELKCQALERKEHVI